VPPEGAAHDNDASSSLPPFSEYSSKSVRGELLSSHSEAAAVKDGDGELPLCPPIEFGSTCTGGVKSLYDANPDSNKELDMDQYRYPINEALSFSSQQDHTKTDSEDGNGKGTTDPELKKEEHYICDASMLVQKSDACLDAIQNSLGAHPDDVGACHVLRGYHRLTGCKAAPLVQQAAEGENPDECNEYAGIVLGRIAAK